MNALHSVFRMLRQSPRIVLLAVATLAVGIGAVAISFAALYAIVLRPLPLVQRQQDIVHVTSTLISKGEPDLGVALPDFEDLCASSATLEGAGVSRNAVFLVSNEHGTEYVQGAELSCGLFHLLGVEPVQGRNFRPEDESSGPPVVIISHRFWLGHCGGAAVLGQPCFVDGERRTIVGVMPPRWQYPQVADVWIPLTRRATNPWSERGKFVYDVKARLNPGRSAAEAQAELSARAGALAARYPATNSGVDVRVIAWREKLNEQLGRYTMLLFGAAGCVLLIACANIANLLLARTVMRAHETAIKLALGASRGRIVREHLAESGLLALAGAALGAMLALWGIGALADAFPENTPFWIVLEPDALLTGVIVATAAFSTLVYGLWPALRAARPDLMHELKDAGRSATLGSRSRRFRQVLVIGQIAAALVLVVTSGLLVRSLVAVQTMDRGFNASNVVTFRTGVPAGEGTGSAAAVFFDQLEQRLAASPDVVCAGAIDALPALLPGARGRAAVVVEGNADPVNYADLQFPFRRVASAGYFQVLQIPLVAGRSFRPADTADAPPVALVDTAFVRNHFGQANPLGRRFRLRDHSGGADGLAWIQIVGVVGSVKHRPESDFEDATFYLPLTQRAASTMSVVLRTRPAGGRRADALSLARSLNPSTSIFREKSLQEVVRESQWRGRFFGWLFALSAVVALFLALVGTYGVMSYHVAQRRAEIAVRLSLGANPRALAWQLVGDGLRLVTSGVLFGTVGALVVARLCAGQLVGVSPHDLVTFATAIVLVAACAAAACWLAARNATRLTPVELLRVD